MAGLPSSLVRDGKRKYKSSEIVGSLKIYRESRQAVKCGVWAGVWGGPAREMKKKQKKKSTQGYSREGAEGVKS